MAAASSGADGGGNFRSRDGTCDWRGGAWWEAPEPQRRPLAVAVGEATYQRKAARDRPCRGGSRRGEAAWRRRGKPDGRLRGRVDGARDEA